MKQLILPGIVALLVSGCGGTADSIASQSFSIEERAKLFDGISELGASGFEYSIYSGDRKTPANPELTFFFEKSFIEMRPDSAMTGCLNYMPVFVNFVFEDSFNLLDGITYHFKDEFDKTYQDISFTAGELNYYRRIMNTTEKLDLVLSTMRFPYEVKYGESLIEITLQTNFRSGSNWEAGFDSHLQAYAQLVYAYVMLKNKRYTGLHFKTINTDEYGLQQSHTYESDRRFLNIETIKTSLNKK